MKLSYLSLSSYVLLNSEEYSICELRADDKSKKIFPNHNLTFWVELLGCNIIHNLLQDWQGFWHDSQDFASVRSSQILQHLQQNIYTPEKVLANCQSFRSVRKTSWITKRHLQGGKNVNQRPWMMLNCKAGRELCLNTQVDWSQISGSRVNPKLEFLRFLNSLGKWQEYYMAKHMKYALSLLTIGFCQNSFALLWLSRISSRIWWSTTS